MDDHSSAPSSWPPNCFWEVGVQQQHDYGEAEADDLKQALLRTTLELESTRLVAQEELKKMEAQSLHLAHLLQIATRERDEARHHCRSLLLLLSKTNPNPNPNPNPGPNLEESSNTASSSEEEEEESSKLTSPAVEAAVRERGLPERGRLVEAVMRAGPLLQTLLLAGPLPQWRHPPPAIQSFEIPPVSINVNPTNDEKKRKRDAGQQQSPPPNLNMNSSSLSSSPESNASTKFHHHHHNNNLQQFGWLRS